MKLEAATPLSLEFKVEVLNGALAGHPDREILVSRRFRIGDARMAVLKRQLAGVDTILR